MTTSQTKPTNKIETITSFCLSKVIVIITGNTVTQHKLSRFEELASKYNDINLSGLLSLKKYEKYKAMLTALGFQELELDRYTWKKLSLTTDTGLDVYNINVVFSRVK